MTSSNHKIKSMLQRHAKGVDLTEMSYEDFLETFGRSQSLDTGKDSLAKNRTEGDNILSTDSSTCPTVTGSDFRPCSNSVDNSTEIILCRSLNQKDKDMNVDMESAARGPCSVETKRRNSKLQDMANRLARKSFRVMRKKTSSESSNSSQSSKWNPFVFKRSRSSSRTSTDGSQDGSSRSSTGNQSFDRLPPVTSSKRNVRPSFARSMSQIQVPSSHSSSENSLKRYSDDEDTKKRFSKNFEDKKNNNKPFATAGDRKHYSRPTFLPLSLAPSDPHPFSPEYDVIKKCDDIREEEQTRLVAIATLLKRRRNSLKIKCDQFNKELSQKNIDERRAKVIRARLREMHQKLEVVDQCIDEQAEEMKTTSAKVNLILSLELYKLNLLREEKNGFKSPRRKLRKGKNPLSVSCETLLSMDDACVFDGLSAKSAEKKTSSAAPSPSRSLRRYSAYSAAPTTHSPTRPVPLSADDLIRNHTSTNRSQSMDNAVTSDCDSGFDNGDVFSRSDISLNRSFSKSTGSIASESSHPISASCLDRSSPGTHPSNCFFSDKLHSNPELSLYVGKSAPPSKAQSSSINKLEETKAVDPSVMAAIEDFEKFAEKTRRRLSLHGKLVPLKK